MQAYGCLGYCPTSFDGGGSCKPIGTWFLTNYRSRRLFTASATVKGGDGDRNHYSVLGVPPNASSSDIKRAYRLLALKYHPDVNKEVGADVAFKSVRHAYDAMFGYWILILIDETTRDEYDEALEHQKNATRPLGDDEWAINPEYEDGLRFYKWAYLRRKMRREKYWDQYYNTRKEHFSFYDDTDQVSEEETPDEERGSFLEVLRSTLVLLFLMQTVGIRLSLSFSSLMALIDRKLDAGYKFGYLFAWILGGRGGILLTMFLSFASWVCGKRSSSVVALVVVAMWFGSNLARYVPLPQGALLTLLYMSIKLQGDIN